VLTIDAGLLSDTAIQGTHIIVLEFCFDMLRFSMKKEEETFCGLCCAMSSFP
jgi:hypothetical protein